MYMLCTNHGLGQSMDCLYITITRNPQITHPWFVHIHALHMTYTQYVYYEIIVIFYSDEHTTTCSKHNFLSDGADVCERHDIPAASN